MIEITLLVISVIINIGLLFYARWLIKILQTKEEETNDISEILAEYIGHVKSVHEMEMFYGDQTLMSLVDHGKELVNKIENFDYILYEREDEEMEDGGES